MDNKEFVLKKSSTLKMKEVKEFILKSSTAPSYYDSANWPLLLKNYDKMNVRSNHYTPIAQGCTPLQRPLKEYLKYGVINLDKPPRPSSHEVVTWAKNVLKDLGITKTGHSGTLDPKVSGNLLISIDRATRLVKSQQNAGKQYMCIVRFHGKVSKDKLILALRHMHGPVYQRPPIISAVKRRLRVRTLHYVKLLEFNEKRGLAVLHMKCQAGTYVRTFCIHLGMLCGQAAHMQELRRIKSGHLGERHNMVTMHDLMDAKYYYDSTGNESYLRSVIMPLEILLIHLKRIVVKDTSINAICHGAQIMVPGVLRFDNSIDIGDEVVIMSTKGEAICLAYAQMTTNQMSTIDHGMVAKIKRVIMDRGTYPKRWGLGPYAIAKKKMVKEGQLDKYGNANEQTPKEWTADYPDIKLMKFKEKVEADPSYVYIQKHVDRKVSKAEVDFTNKDKKEKFQKKRTAIQADLDHREPPTKRIKLEIKDDEIEIEDKKDIISEIIEEKVTSEEIDVKKKKKKKSKKEKEKKKKKKKKKIKKSKGIEVN